MRKRFEYNVIIPLMNIDDIIDVLVEDEKIKCSMCKNYKKQNNLFVCFDGSIKVKCKKCL